MTINGFTNFFGVPYFVRRLPKWGLLFLATSIVGNIFQVALGTQPILLLLSAGYIAIAIGMGIKGNEITAKAYLEKGWIFANPDSNSVSYARSKWHIDEPIKEAA